ncbi:MAG: peptidylprolyl isomerase, partial [Acidimicrobiia bacterium]
MTVDLATTYKAKIQTNHGDITLELLPERSPQTVNNFVFLARDGFYDGVIFH